MASPLSVADFKSAMEKLFGEIQSVKEDLATHKNDQSRLWVAVNRLQTTQLEQIVKPSIVLVVEDGSNWSMGQRQLFCLGRALLRRCRILVLDEATASIDNATDVILQKTIRAEFKDCTVITVAHRIPTVMDCTRVLAMSDGKVMEYDKPTKLMETEGSLFRELVKEYWSYTSNGNI